MCSINIFQKMLLKWQDNRPNGEKWRREERDRRRSGRRKSNRRSGGRRRKRVRFVVHSVGVAFEWQIDNWSLLSYDWALLSRYFCVHSSISFRAFSVDPFGDFQRRTLLRVPPAGSKVARVTWTPAASVAHSSPKSYLSMHRRMWTIILGLGAND